MFSSLLELKVLRIGVVALAAVSAAGWQGGDALELKRAKQLWEQLLTAKGGRARLSSIRTMAQIEHGYLRIPNPRFKSGEQHLVRAYAFPDRVWQWADASSTVLGMELSVYNLSTSTGYSVRPGIGPPMKMTGADNLEAGVDYLREAQLVYLNESAWLHPQVQRLLATQRPPSGVDAIETLVEGKRVDFHIDRKTHLPAQIVVYDPRTFPTNDPRAFKTTYELYDYRDVAGIQVPHRVVMTISLHTGTIRFDTQLNVPIREDLFTSPPSIEDGPDGWKPRSSASPP